MANYSKLLEKIKEYDNISIFRHAVPDGDAVFSQMALYTFLKDNFKNKKVKNCGFESYDLLNNVQKVSDSFIKKSLAIVLDTSNDSRVDDQRYSSAAYVVKIDHHPPFENYGDLNYVRTSAAAVCELVVEILYSKPFSKYKKSKKVCEYLYCGILTDTLNFKIATCTDKTLAYATKLVKDGDLNMSDLSNYVFEKNLDTFNKLSKMRTYLKVKGHLGYLILDKKVLDKIGLSYLDAKNNIAEFNNISDINVWCIFVYNHDKKYYEGSLRSKRKYIINSLARQYNGGGHPNACGVRNLTLSRVKSLINELEKLSNLKL